MTGIGRRAVRPVKTDRGLKLDVDSLRRQVRQDRKDGWAPFMVVGTAGTTAAGVIDPLPEIAQLCHDEKLWFHADAAWGGAAILSPAVKEHLAGIEHADSITCDAHKWLSVSGPSRSRPRPGVHLSRSPDKRRVTMFLPLVADIIANEKHALPIAITLILVSFYSSSALLNFYVGHLADSRGSQGPD